MKEETCDNCGAKSDEMMIGYHLPRWIAKAMLPQWINALLRKKKDDVLMCPQCVNKMDDIS